MKYTSTYTDCSTMAGKPVSFLDRQTVEYNSYGTAPIRGFSLSPVREGEGAMPGWSEENLCTDLSDHRFRVLALTGVQVSKDVTKATHWQSAGNGYITDLHHHEMDCNNKFLVEPRVLTSFKLQSNQEGQIKFSYTCASAHGNDKAIVKPEWWGQEEGSWRYTNWSDAGDDLTALTGHTVWCLPGQAIGHLRAEMELPNKFRWAWRCLSVEVAFIEPETSAEDFHQCMNEEKLTKKSHAKACKKLKGDGENVCEASNCKYKSKYNKKKDKTSTSCKPLKATQIKCAGASLENCCKFAGCYVDAGECKGEFSGFTN